MLDVVQRTARETTYYRLRAICLFAEEAREQGAFDVANEACAYLLAYALDEDSDGEIIRIDIATTDEYGKARNQTKHELVILKHLASGCRTIIPIRLLTLDALGMCYRRVGGDFERRAHPHGRPTSMWASEETRRRLRDKFTNLVGGDGVQKARAVLNTS